MSDVQRKRVLAEWVVKTKKQVVKLYAVVKWSRDADVVHKAMVRSLFHVLTSPYRRNPLSECYRISYGPEPAIRCGGDQDCRLLGEGKGERIEFACRTRS